MRKILLLATCFSFFTAISYADEGTEYTHPKVALRAKKRQKASAQYLSIKGGISQVKAKVDGLNLSGKDEQPLVDFVFGTKKEDFKGEIDFTYRHGNDFETKNLSIMANAYL